MNDTQSNNKSGSYAYALSVLTTLFFMWGFITSLNDILIPHLKAVFSLNYTEAMLIQFTFFFSYFVFSMPSGIIIEKIGYKKGIVGGLITSAVGTLMFYPAAAIPSYGFFLSALFVLAAGITMLQVSANPYVTILGKPKTAASRLNLTQAFNSLGTTVGPYLGSLLILSTVVKTAEELAKMTPSQVSAYKTLESAAVQEPYLGIAALLFVLAAVFAFIKLPIIDADSIEKQQQDDGSAIGEAKHAWSYTHLVFGAVGIFVYVGAEVSIGSFLVSYMGEPYIASMPAAEAGKYVSFYWGAAMVGRFIGSGIQSKINPRLVLSVSAIVAGILVLISIITSGSVAMWAILAVGLFNSIMFPTIFSLGVNGLGRHTSQGSGILIMAIVGGAIIPLLMGALADNIGVQMAFILPLICYIYIAWYGSKGAEPKISGV